MVTENSSGQRQRNVTVKNTGTNMSPTKVGALIKPKQNAAWLEPRLHTVPNWIAAVLVSLFQHALLLNTGAQTPTPTITPPPAVCSVTEGFDDITNLVSPKGWIMTNHSTVVGSTSWFQGSTAVFVSHSGATNSYIGANYTNDGGPGTDTISNWLLTPPVTLQNGGTLIFYTRTVDIPQFPDRLQVRYSTNTSSTNVGTTPTDVGDFTHLVLDINPTLTTAGYPNVWTQFTVTLSGLGLPSTGRFAFRYFVTNGGPSGVNSDYIGIDTVSYNCEVFPPCPTASPSPSPGTPSPTPSPTPAQLDDITLVSRLSDARVSASVRGISDNPAPRIQTDFLAANLTNFAKACFSGFEGGTSTATSTSKSSIDGDASMGTLRVTGNGAANPSVGPPNSGANATAKLIVLTFTLTGAPYTYSLTGQLYGAGTGFSCPSCGTATATLSAGSPTVFCVIAGGSSPSNTATLSQSGILSPGTYTFSVDLATTGYFNSFSGSNANFNFLLTRCPGCTPTTGCQVLYDQTDNPSSNAINSQDFEPARDQYDAQGAEGFVISAGQTWRIQQIFAGGFFSNWSPAPPVNVFFYSDSGGLPGASVATYLNAAGVLDSTGNLTTTVPGSGLVLGPGAYWVSIQLRQDYSSGVWYWKDRSTTSNGPAAWQNPGGGDGVGCTTWGQRATTCGMDPTTPDQIFQILGCPVTAAPTATPVPTPATVSISGNVGNCASPAPTANPPASPTPSVLPAVPNVLMTLSGSSAGTTITDSSGTYSFVVNSGSSYTVTPSKGPLPSGSAGINTTDVLTVQRHFLGVSTIPSGCRVSAADAVINGTINTQDVIAIQRFFLGLTSGTGSVGQYQFVPASSTYPALNTNQTTDYAMYVVGDVAGPFNNRPEDTTPSRNSPPLIDRD